MPSNEELEARYREPFKPGETRVGYFLRLRRATHGQSAAKLAERIEVSDDHLSNLRLGVDQQRFVDRLRVFVKLAIELDLSLEELLEEDWLWWTREGRDTPNSAKRVSLIQQPRGLLDEDGNPLLDEDGIPFDLWRESR